MKKETSSHLFLLLSTIYPNQGCWSLLFFWWVLLRSTQSLNSKENPETNLFFLMIMMMEKEAATISSCCCDSSWQVPNQAFQRKALKDQRKIELHSHPQISSSWWWWWRRRVFAISCCCCEPSWGWVHNCWNNTCALSSLQVATKAEQNARQQWEIFFYNKGGGSAMSHGSFTFLFPKCSQLDPRFLSQILFIL